MALKTKGIKIKTLKKFLKNACSMGWMNWELNFIKAANTEKRKQDEISKKIGYMLYLNYTLLQFICEYVNKNDEFKNTW